MTPETAWAEAMKFENRPNPYRFFDELRKTPVAHVGNGVYAVTGYRELMALAHDPRISSDTRRLKARAASTAGSESGTDPSLEAYGEHGSMIVSDPPDHDRMRRQAMRHFGPPHTPDLIPSTEPAIRQLCNELLDRAKGKTRIDVVDDYAYPVPVMVICKILGVPHKDEPQFHEFPRPSERVLGFRAVLGLHPRADRSGQPRPGRKDQDAGGTLPPRTSGRGVSPPPRRKDQGTRGHHAKQLTNIASRNGDT
jgi:cytochrome P450